jgi:hypothetical protein
MSEQWTIRLRSQPVLVSGFDTSQAAREHVAKHYLDPKERWEQLQPKTRESIAQAQQVAGTHGKVSEPFFALLDATAVVYLVCVRAETETAVRVEQITYVDQRGQRVQRIDTVTKSGVYAAFSVVPRNEVSDLRTAMRQYHRTIKNPRPGDYLNWAHARLSARLSGARFSDD